VEEIQIHEITFLQKYMQQTGESKNLDLGDTAKDPEILERLKHRILPNKVRRGK